MSYAYSMGYVVPIAIHFRWEWCAARSLQGCLVMHRQPWRFLRAVVSRCLRHHRRHLDVRYSEGGQFRSVRAVNSTGGRIAGPPRLTANSPSHGLATEKEKLRNLGLGVLGWVAKVACIYFRNMLFTLLHQFHARVNIEFIVFVVMSLWTFTLINYAQTLGVCKVFVF